MKVVYFVANGSAIKIGFSSCLESRLTSIACGSSTPLQVLFTVEGGRRHERTVHNELAPFRLNGEWFQDCPEVRRAIENYRLNGIQPTNPNKDRHVYSAPREYDASDTLEIDLFRLPMADARSAYLKNARSAMEAILAEIKRQLSVGADVAPLKARADLIFKEAGL